MGETNLTRDAKRKNCLRRMRENWKSAGEIAKWIITPFLHCQWHGRPPSIEFPIRLARSLLLLAVIAESYKWKNTRVTFPMCLSGFCKKAFFQTISSLDNARQFSHLTFFRKASKQLAHFLHVLLILNSNWFISSIFLSASLSRVSFSVQP